MPCNGMPRQSSGGPVSRMASDSAMLADTFNKLQLAVERNGQLQRQLQDQQAHYSNKVDAIQSELRESNKQRQSIEGTCNKLKHMLAEERNAKHRGCMRIADLEQQLKCQQNVINEQSGRASEAARRHRELHNKHMQLSRDFKVHTS